MKMNDKEKEANGAEAILAILLFGIPLIALCGYFIYVAFTWHILIGLWFCAITIAAANWIIKRIEYVNSRNNEDELT